MSSELRYERIDKNFKDIDKVEEIYVKAFPPQERVFTIRQVLEMEDVMGKSDHMAAYDGNEVIGFYSLSIRDDYKYLNFIAVNSAIRGKGYGGIILRKLLEDNKDTILFAAIEKPIPGVENYEIKLRRKNFYERNGMIVVDYERDIRGIRFLTITNKTGEEFERCYKKAVEEQESQMKMADK